MANRPATSVRLAPPLAAALSLAAVLGCSPAGPTVAPSSSPSGLSSTAAASPSPAASRTPIATPAPTAVPRPSGALAWPTAFDVEFEPGTYFSSPPFLVPFTLEVSEAGWFSGHLNEVFFDLLRFDGVAHTELPTRMLAFGLPGNVRGPDGTVDADGLSADAAVDAIEGADDRTTSNRAPIQLLGLEGVVVDIHSELSNTPIFGNEAGNFGLSPDRDTRLAVLERDDGLLVIAVLAETADLDAAWDQALPIMESVDFIE